MFLSLSITPVSSRRGVLDGPGPRLPVRLYQAGVHDHLQRQRQQPCEGGGPEPALRGQPRRPRRRLDCRVRPPKRPPSRSQTQSKLVQLQRSPEFWLIKVDTVQKRSFWTQCWQCYKTELNCISEEYLVQTSMTKCISTKCILDSTPFTTLCPVPSQTHLLDRRGDQSDRSGRAGRTLQEVADPY